MGVSGLTSFIDSHPQLLRDYALHDTRLVIDGNNLYHFLYYYYHVRHECAGDYDVFHASCTAFFTALRTCAVTPYVVFDGAHHEDNRKFKTSLRRAAERLHLAGFLSIGNRAKILPILAYETFRNVLDEMRVAHVTCYLEADEEIAALAQLWTCPVLTNDSDFFVYDLPGGVVPLDYINMTVLELKVDNKALRNVDTSGKNPAKEFFISAQIYFLDGLVRLLKFRERPMVALAATLIGNDVVGKHNFEQFYVKARLVKPTNGAQKSKAPGATVASIFDWLGSTNGVKDAVSRVLKFIPDSKRDFVRDLIEKSTSSYTKLDCSIIQYFERDPSSPPIHVPVVLLSFGSHELPVWFLDRVRSGSIPVRALSAVTRRRVILLSQVEVMSQPSAYDCSLRLRSCFYSILLTIDQSAASAEENRTLVIQEHGRQNKSVKCTPVIFLDRFATGVPVPSMMVIPSLDDDERLMLLTDALSPSFNSSRQKQELMKDIPADVRVLILTIAHWTLHAEPKVNDLHVKALLVCCISLGGLGDWILRTSEEGSRISRGEEDSDIDTKHPIVTGFVGNADALAELGRIKTELTLRFSDTPRVNNASAFDGATVHSFCQYQTCLQATIYLAQLLGVPSYSTLHPALTFNGTFLYNLLQDLQSRANPDLYIEQLIGRDSSLTAKFKQMFSILSLIQPSDTLLSAAETGTRRTRAKKSKLHKDNVNKTELFMADGEVEEDDRAERMSYDVDIANKFSVLNLMSNE